MRTAPVLALASLGIGLSLAAGCATSDSSSPGTDYPDAFGGPGSPPFEDAGGFFVDAGAIAPRPTFPPRPPPPFRPLPSLVGRCW